LSYIIFTLDQVEIIYIYNCQGVRTEYFLDCFALDDGTHNIVPTYQ